MEQAYAVIKGVKVPVMVVDGVELPTALIQGYEGTIEVHNVKFDGDKTYDFYVKDLTYGLDTHCVEEFDPRD